MLTTLPFTCAVKQNHVLDVPPLDIHFRCHQAELRSRCWLLLATQGGTRAMIMRIFSVFDASGRTPQHSMTCSEALRGYPAAS